MSAEHLLNAEKVYRKDVLSGRAISHHLPILRWLPSQATNRGNYKVIELGTGRGASTNALMLGFSKWATPPEYHSYDLVTPARLAHLEKWGVNFHQQDVADIPGHLARCDMCFIDDLHTKEQVDWELYYFGMRCRDLLLLHDTHSRVWPGVRAALTEWATTDPEAKKFELLLDEPRNHGLTIFRRVKP